MENLTLSQKIEKLKVHRVVYRFKVSLVDDPQVYRYIDIESGVGAVNSFLNEYFFHRSNYEGKKLEVIGFIEID